jgi:hypothetical protein
MKISDEEAKVLLVCGDVYTFIAILIFLIAKLGGGVDSKDHTLFLLSAFSGVVGWIANWCGSYKRPCWIPFASVFYRLSKPLRKKIKWRE